MERFLASCSEIVQRHRGSVASYIGDAVNAYFGYPVADDNEADALWLLAYAETVILPPLAVAGASRAQVG